MKYNFECIKPDYENKHFREHYTAEIMNEFKQCTDEGLDIKKYRELFEAVDKLPAGEIKKKMGDVIFEAVMKCDLLPDYKYDEPSSLEEITALRSKHVFSKKEPDMKTLESKIHGAWMGRVCGCLLGKPVEGIRSHDMVPLLRDTCNLPMHRYINKSDITEELYEKIEFNLRDKCFADITHGMPVDDDTNYVVLYQQIIENYGRNFTSENVAEAWVKYQSVNSYFTAERIAFENIVNGYRPPVSAIYKNACREWIGAQIRGDYFGYINPGKPEEAAKMAFTDACISHVKNGIYGEMFASAMIAAAAVTDSIEDILLAGLGEIPSTSRLYESVKSVLDDYKKGISSEGVFRRIHEEYDEYTGYGWCHTISNAMIVSAALLYGEGDFGKSICMAVEACFDTDCNGATVGSVLGMRNGIEGISEEWTKPVENTIHTSIFGFETVKISDCVKLTLKHILS